MAKNKWRNRLGAELMAAVVTSLLCGILLFLGLQKLSNSALDRYAMSYEYYEKQQARSAKRLQEYLDRNQVSLKEISKLDEWVVQEQYVSVLIYQSQKLIYTSYPMKTENDTAAEEEENTALDNYYFENSQENVYQLQFTDGTAQVILFSYYEYRYYLLAATIEGLAGFLLFILLFLWQIRKKTSYIELLKNDLQILEGGNLEYQVTVRGSDELGELAEGIDRMRCSIIERDENEEKARKANQELVTAMSHDLRSPLTSLLGYLELLDGGDCDDEQQKHFIKSSRKKAVQIKEMSDRLFEYFLVYGKASEEIVMEPVDAMALFEQTVCESAYDLECQGFTVCVEMEDAACRLMVNTELFRRTVNNVFSNLVKYADTDFPVQIGCRKDGDGVFITFYNRKNRSGGVVESSGIGIKTCQKIMKEHGGWFEVKDGEMDFKVTLFFPEAK